MGIVGNLPKALGLTSDKVWAGTGHITGTGSIVTDLGTIDAGSAQVTVQDSALTLPTNIATVSSITDGSVDVVVVALAAAANAISDVVASVGLLCTGH
jgi:hypothetical protein